MVAVVFTPAHGGDCFNDAGQRECCYCGLFLGSILVATNAVIFSALIGRPFSLAGFNKAVTIFACFFVCAENLAIVVVDSEVRGSKIFLAVLVERAGVGCRVCVSIGS